MTKLARLGVVAALLACLATPASAVCTLTSPPTLDRPLSGTEDFGSVEFRWNPSTPAAPLYELWIRIDGGSFASKGTTSSNRKTVVLEPGRSIEWKIAAVTPECELTSAAASFNTSCPNAVPSLKSPDRGETLPAGTQITFDWTAVAGATSYDVKVTPDFGATWQVLVENTTQTSFRTSALGPGDWGWEVRANFNGACPPAYSEPSQFYVISCPTPTPPTLLNPPAGDTSVANPVTFQWSKVDGAAEYRLYASIDGAAANLLTTTTDTQRKVTMNGTSVSWTVEALFPDTCPGATSATSSFTLSDSSCPANPGKATLNAPSAGAANLVSPVTFKWNSVSGAKEYRVFAIFADGQPVSLGSTSSTSLTSQLPAGSGLWFVQTVFGTDCPTTVSDRRAFTVSTGASCTANPPQPLAPPNGATNVDSPVEFRWSKVDSASSYQLFLAAGETDFTFYGETTDTKLERLVPAGLIRWYVVAKSIACADQKSSTVAFSAGRADTCVQLSPTRQSPADGSEVASPVRFSWSSVPAAEVYRLWASVGNSTPVMLTRTTSTEAVVSLPSGVIRWFVEAIHADCPPNLSDTGQFTVSVGSNCGSHLPVSLVSPLGTQASPATVSSPVSFAWTPAAAAIGYRIFAARNGEPFDDFDLTKNTTTTAELEPGLYRWYVRTFFEACPPLDSPVAWFKIEETTQRCPQSGPVLLAPAENATTTSPVTLTWTAVPGASRYRILASRDGSEPELIGVTTTGTLVRVLPPGSYSWLVEAVFATCPSKRSPAGRFTIPRSANCSADAPQLVSPPHDSTAASNEIDFSWTPVSGAVKYVLFIEVDEGAETAIASTTDTHVTRKVPSGEVEWWVVAHFAGCDPIEADDFTVHVPRQAGCPERRPLLLYPSERDPVTGSPVTFAWTAVAEALEYRVWVRSDDENEVPAMVASTTATKAVVPLATGRYEWFVEAVLPQCPSASSAVAEFDVDAAEPCARPHKTVASVIGRAQSGSRYSLRWSPLPNVALYEVQEATSLDFSDATTVTTDDFTRAFVHEVTTSPSQFLYRVRGVSSCSDERGPYSDVVGVVVFPPQTTQSSAEVGESAPIVQKVFLPGSSTPTQFSATSDKSWITIVPSSGSLPAEGITLEVTADPKMLALGTNTGTISVVYTAAATTLGEEGSTTSSIPFSVSLVTPVVPSGQGTPPPDALIFPVVGHAAGANGSFFESDIRLTNLTAQTMQYELNFTPSGGDGTQSSSSTTIELPSGGTLAVDDILSSLFGLGLDSGTKGMLEVRPLTTVGTSSANLFTAAAASAIRTLNTAASSRTYNFTPSGTFGQFIPAIPFAEFVGAAANGAQAPILSLQQVAQSSAFRANFGFAEASGQAADLQVRVFDTANQLLTSIPVSLQPREHRQIDGMLAANGISSLENGRVEVEVAGGGGKVTAYVSEVDNQTNDPLLVSPVVKGEGASTKWVVPGVAYTDNGLAFWVTDLRIYNSGGATPATLTFYPWGNPGAPVTREVQLDAGEIEVIDNVLGGLFSQPNGAGGAIHISTPADATLNATARTYNSTASGTYGQYIPGVTPGQSIALGDRALQILQLEQSSRFRTNIGVAETSGAPVTVEVMAYVPDSIATPVVTFDLAANEFRQFSLAEFNLGENVYNVRVAVKVLAGNGRVTAYGSAIDQITQDPTYVPAQ